MTDTEAPLRHDLATALRWAARLGLHEGVCNHFSVVVPKADGANTRRFLINPEGLHWDEMTPEAIVSCALDDEGEDVPDGVEATAYFIHREIHRLVPHATCALHTHMPYATALTLRRNMRLRMASQNALRFYGRIAYDDHYGGLALGAEEGERIAGALGKADIAFLANHGVVAVAETVAEAFDDLYYLERACQTQILAETGGAELRDLDEATCTAVAAQFVSERAAGANRHFEALKRMAAAGF